MTIKTKNKKNDINGWLNINKPQNISSNKALSILKKILRPKKIGHAGTLDPLAYGVLPVALGEATKTVQYIQETPKTYRFEVTFGHATDTADLEGEVIDRTDNLPKIKDLEASIKSFIGNIKQTPPKYSAVKINGKRAYVFARAGEDFEIKQREVSIYKIAILEHTTNHKNEVIKANIECKCSKGTYVRSLAEDIAKSVNSLGYVSDLQRTEYGSLKFSKAVNIDKILAQTEDGKDLKEEDLQLFKNMFIESLLPVAAGLDDIPVLQLERFFCDKLKNGISIRNLSLLDNSLYSVFDDSDDQNLIAICRFEQNLLLL